MHIGILTQYYAPELGAPQRRLAHLAESFTRRGHRVTVLTAMPSYPKGIIYPGYGGWRLEEKDASIRVVRTFIYPTQSAGLLPRLANYFSFVLSSLLLGGWKVEPCDYMLVESPPLFLGLSGYLLSRWKGARWIFNVSDLWPESAVRVGVLHPGPLLSLARGLEAFCYQHAWLVTCQSQSIMDDIRPRFPQVRTRLVSNGVDTETFKPDAAHPRLAADGRSAAVYAGLHGLAQGLDQVVTAAGLLREEDRLDVWLLGDGPCKPALVHQARAATAEHLHFLDPLPAPEIPGWLAGGDMAIVPLGMYIPGAVPSKLYEAMAAGLPVVLVAAGEPAEIVRRHRAGIVVAPGDITGLAQALRALAADPALRRELGTNGRRAVEQCYNRRRIHNDLVEWLEQQPR